MDSRRRQRFASACATLCGLVENAGGNISRLDYTLLKRDVGSARYVSCPAVWVTVGVLRQGICVCTSPFKRLRPLLLRARRDSYTIDFGMHAPGVLERVVTVYWSGWSPCSLENFPACLIMFPGFPVTSYLAARPQIAKIAAKIFNHRTAS